MPLQTRYSRYQLNLLSIILCRNTDLCSNLFRGRTMIVPHGARGDARAKRTHWGILAPWDALRYRCAHASHHHFLYLFNAAPPQTPPPKAKILKRKWLVVCSPHRPSKSFIQTSIQLESFLLCLSSSLWRPRRSSFECGG